MEATPTPTGPSVPPAPRSFYGERGRAIWARLRGLSSKPPMVLYLGFLLLLGVWRPSFAEFPGGLWRIQGDLSLLWRGILIVVLYSVFDLALGYLRERKWILPSSAWISGLILSLVLTPTAPAWVVVAAPLIASLGKHAIRRGKKHLFNPAGLALVILGFALPAQGIVSWWGASWGPVALVLIVVSGAVTIFRVKRWKTWLAFLLTYVIGALLVFSLSPGRPFADTNLAWQLRTLLLDGTLWFFSTVMLIEPVTTAYTPAAIRTWFGVGVGILVLLLSLPGAPAVPDPFLVSLLLGNLGATIASLLTRR